MTGTSLRRPPFLVVALLAVVALVVGLVATPAHAAPNDPPNETNGTLREVIAAASKAYVEAQAAYDASRKRQVELTTNLAAIEAKYAVLSREASQIASAAFRMPRATTAMVLLDNASPDSLLDRMTTIRTITYRQDRTLRELTNLRNQLTAAKTAIDAEATEQQKQLAIVSKRKLDAERELAKVGGAATSGYVVANSPAAQASPRNANGSLPSEGCSLNDPTTGGCISPRTLHGLQEARLYGFTRHTSCYRSYNDGGDHPVGKACDFSVSASGFGGTATGGDRMYGNNLAAFFVRNAYALGVKYCIWFNQIWFPGLGWRRYYGGGDPSSNHENHVHTSYY